MFEYGYSYSVLILAFLLSLIILIAPREKLQFIPNHYFQIQSRASPFLYYYIIK